ncbi:TPA: hypothetical protein EYP37_04305 [Candidatus Poribacteria bacterium]|nr:hypothetical protein [Candidatus Poribacteria bacterium]
MRIASERWQKPKRRCSEMIRWMFIGIALSSMLLILVGCDTDKSCYTPDTTPPATPRGVRTITGDGKVTIEWYGSDEPDLAGYRVYRSDDNVHFEMIAEVSGNITRYVDRDVRNGETYYYAVSSFDLDGNESDLSPEEVWDTPRPEGRVILDEYQLSPDTSGFDFSNGEQGPVPYDRATTDIYFDADNGVYYLLSDNGTLMQDMGYHESWDDLDIAPDKGYVGDIIEILEGHTYAFYTPEGNYAKIKVLRLTDRSVTFDWAYQLEPDNPQLAPRKP